MLTIARDECAAFLRANARGLEAGDGILEIETYGVLTNCLARGHPERS